ncbi:MAG: prepilin-type N-terminal cleavage/methylation domain-containing protein [Elusimicrobiaceae bacterium]|nr:prepilin-type N-terminal cleavage/methylation domain-containing protein [Elusimicrobiaceae bacterium]
MIRNSSRGFTLIELLVVVLIIGILSAIALPQYEKVIWKIRVAQIIPVVRSLAEAEQRYFLANGTYTTNMNELDISFSQPTSYDTGKMYWTLHAQEANSYKHVYAEIDRWGDTHFYIRYDLANEKMECYPESVNTKGEKICKLLSQQTPYRCPNRPQNFTCYEM